jgi:hypothetical protein
MSESVSLTELADALGITVQDLLDLANVQRLAFDRDADGFHHIREQDLVSWKTAIEEKLA